MIPEAFKKRIDKELQEYREHIYYYYYWNFRTPKTCLQQNIMNLHDQGTLTQGELSEKWTLCFNTPIPFLPTLDMPDTMTWDEVYQWLEHLEPVQLRLLYNKININPRKF